MLQAVELTLKLGALTTIILLVVATPFAWWLARYRFWGKEVIGAVISLPLVLPPTVLGFYLLLVLSPTGPVGSVVDALFGVTLPFTFAGLVVGSVVYSLPFMVQPLRNAFEALGDRPLEAAATLRASPLDRFFSIAAPLARPGFLTGIVLTFAHTAGEFGVILMLGGNIPGKTKVMSVAIYDHVESLEYDQAHILAAGMVAGAFALILTLTLWQKKLELRNR